MIVYVARKNAAVAALEREFGISHLHASEIANAWEYDAGRRGIDWTAPAFWTLGHGWMARQAAWASRSRATLQPR